MHMEVLDVITGLLVLDRELHPPLAKGQEAAFENLLFVGGRLWVILTTLDRTKTEVLYTLYAWPVDPSTGESAGGLVPIGEVPMRANATGLEHPSRIGVTVGTSPNGRHAEVVFDKIQFESKQIMMTWVLKEDMTADWQAIFRLGDIQYFDQPRAVRAWITDEGRAYAFFDHGLAPMLSDSVHYPRTQLLQLTREGYLAPIGTTDIDAQGTQGYALTSKGMMVAGSISVNDGKGDGPRTTGVVISQLGDDLRALKTSEVIQLPKFTKEGVVRHILIYARPKGGAYVVCLLSDYQFRQNGLVIASVDEGLRLEWIHQFSRKGNYGTFYAGLMDEALVAYLPESAKTVKGWQNGGGASSARGLKEPLARILCTPAGQVSFSVNEQVELRSNWRVKAPEADPRSGGCVAKNAKGVVEECTCIFSFDQP